MSGSTPAWDDDKGLIDWIDQHYDDFSIDRAIIEPRPALREPERAALLAALSGERDARTAIAVALRSGNPTPHFLSCLAELIEAGGLSGRTSMTAVDNFDRLLWDIRRYTAALRELFPERRSAGGTSIRLRAAELASHDHGGVRATTLLRLIDNPGEDASRRLRLETRVLEATIIA